jgi:hypothetical protein
MKTTLVFPRLRFVEEYRALRSAAQGPVTFSTMQVGSAAGPAGIQILVPPTRGTGQERQFNTLRLHLSTSLAGDSPARFLGDSEAALVLGQGAALGRACGWVRRDGQIEPVHELKLVGPGMHKFRLAAERGNVADVAVRAPQGVDFSHVQGALGAGAWQRLTDLHFAFVGAGRLGGTLAAVLAREGVHKFSLIDPDLVEPHNLAGGFGMDVSDLGHSKVEALARTLRNANPAVQVECVPASVTYWRSAELVAAADFFVSTPDHGSARLAAAWLAALYLKPLLDVGVGVYRANNGRREIGADIRLVWPGHCLMCAGGVRAEPEARRILASAEAERLLRESPRDWRRERAGSLASLNAAAAGVAARMIEDFIEGVLTENPAWTRLGFGADGRLHVSHPIPSAVPEQSCCCRFAGWGDDGIAELTKDLASPLAVTP